MAHDPADRYDTATAMLYDMDEFRKNPLILFPYPLPVTPPILKEVPVTNQRRTTAERVAAGKAGAAGAGKAASGRSTASGRSSASGRSAAAGAAAGTARRRTASASQTGRTAAAASSKRRASSAAQEEDRSRVATIAIVACSIVAIIAIMIFLFTLLHGGGIGNKDDEMVTVPNLTGKYYETDMTYEGFEIRLSETYYDETFAENQILDQEPKAGDQVSKESMVIYVDVSMGPEPQVKQMVDLVDLSLEDAKKYLIAQGVSESNIFTREEHHDTIAVGKITRTDPAEGDEMADDQIVTIWTSLGPKDIIVKMPYVVGLDYNKAYDVLLSSKFTDIEPIFVDSNEPEGEVVGQNIDRNTEVNVTTTIYLEVSKGPTEPPKTDPPQTTAPKETTVETTQASPVITQKTVTITIPNPPAEDFTISLIEGGDFAISDLPLAGGTTSITVTLEGYGIQYYDVWIDGIFTEQVVKVDFAS